MRIRTATPEDAAAVAAVHVASWRVAYRGQLPDELLDGLDVERRTAQWARTLADDDPPRLATALAEDDDGAVVGFVNTRPTRDDDGDPATTGEVVAIYAAPGAWGTGAGRALMATAVETLRGAGFADAVVWVLPGNLRARAFYEAAGWRPDGGAKSGLLGGVTVGELRYRRVL